MNYNLIIKYDQINKLGTYFDFSIFFFSQIGRGHITLELKKQNASFVHQHEDFYFMLKGNQEIC